MPEIFLSFNAVVANLLKRFISSEKCSTVGYYYRRTGMYECECESPGYGQKVSSRQDGEG